MKYYGDCCFILQAFQHIATYTNDHDMIVHCPGLQERLSRFSYRL